MSESLRMAQTHLSIVTDMPRPKSDLGRATAVGRNSDLGQLMTRVARGE